MIALIMYVAGILIGLMWGWIIMRKRLTDKLEKDIKEKLKINNTGRRGGDGSVIYTVDSNFFNSLINDLTK